MMRYCPHCGRNLESEYLPRFRIAKLEKTCGACPAQWEGELDDGSYLYIRYRWGHLRVEVKNETVFSLNHGDAFDGTMDLEELASLTRHVLDFGDFAP